MIEFENRTEHDFSLELIEKITDSLTEKEIELILTDNDDIQQINKSFRNLDKPTDVLSFPYEAMPMAPLGSIIISADFVFSGAEAYGHTPDDEFALLYIHGLLHLLGYDHEVDDGEMRRKEASIIRKFSLPESLIIRTEG
jgi:probable rRNA maturation factor